MQPIVSAPPAIKSEDKAEKDSIVTILTCGTTIREAYRLALESLPPASKFEAAYNPLYQTLGGRILGANPNAFAWSKPMLRFQSSAAAIRKPLS